MANYTSVLTMLLRLRQGEVLFCLPDGTADRFTSLRSSIPCDLISPDRQGGYG